MEDSDPPKPMRCDNRISQSPESLAFHGARRFGDRRLMIISNTKGSGARRGSVNHTKLAFQRAISAFTLEIEGAPGLVRAARAVSREKTSLASGP